MPGDLAAAPSPVERSLTLYREKLDADRVGTFHQLSSLAVIAFLSQVVQSMCRGFAALRHRLPDQALASSREGIGVVRKEDSSWARQCKAACLAGVAAVEAARGHCEHAARILAGESDAIAASRGLSAEQAIELALSASVPFNNPGGALRQARGDDRRAASQGLR